MSRAAAGTGFALAEGMDILSSAQLADIRRILKNAPMPIIITRMSDGVVLLANDHLASFFGLTADTMIGKRAPDFYADPKEREAIMAELAVKGHLIDAELRLKDAQGQELWAMGSIVLTELQGERVVISALNEITARKQAERALKASEEKFRNLVEQANDIIYMLTTDGVFTYVSPNWTRILGHEVSEIEGRSFTPLVHPEDLPACLAFLAKVVETGEPQQGIEYRVRHKDGRWRWHTSNASAVKNDQGETEWFIGIARDITEKKEQQQALEAAHRELRRTQAQLVQAEKMSALGKLVAGIAHEINSPVGAINSIRETLQHASRTIEKELESSGLEPSKKLSAALKALREGTGVLEAGGRRIDEVVHRLRSFASLDEAEIKPCDIHEGIESSLEFLEHDLRGRIELFRDYDEQVPEIVCSPRRLNQVFLNILMNAAQSIDGKGRIIISTRTVPPDHVQVLISDTGRGIEENHLTRIFDPGFTTKGVGVGTGLGLSICYQIIQEHGGDITVESTVGRGTTVTVTLPQRIEALVQPGAGVRHAHA